MYSCYKQMVNTRRSSSHGDRRDSTNSTNPSPATNSPTIEQALMTPTQLLQTLIQHVNNQHQAPPISKRGEFMMGHPPTFSHASDPLEADDWLRAVERHLDIA
jgi:hypothetical protein